MNKVLTLLIPEVVHTVKRRHKVPLSRLSVATRQLIRSGSWDEVAAALQSIVDEYGNFTSAYSRRLYTTFWYLHRRLIRTFRVYGEYKLYYGDALDNPSLYNNTTGEFDPDKVETGWVSRNYTDMPVLESEYYYQRWLESENARMVEELLLDYPESSSSDTVYTYERKRMVKNWQGLLVAMLSYGIDWVKELHAATADDEQYREVFQYRENIDYGVLDPVVTTVIEEFQINWEEIDDDWQYDV